MLAVLVVLGLFGGVAVADKDKARDLISSGDKHLSRGDKLMSRGKKAAAQESYLAALADYNAAYKAFPSPKIYFAIALAEKRLGRYLEALRHFETMLAELKEVPEELRAEVERHVNELKQNLGVIFFRVKPEGAIIEIDGEAIGAAPLIKPHYVVPGEHEYAISRDGYERLTGTVQVEAGDVREDELALKPRAVAGDDDEEDDPEPAGPVEAKPADVTQLYVGLGITGGLAVGATITGLLALSKHNTFEDAGADPATRDDARRSGKTLALITDAMIIGAVAAGTYTAFYYFAVYKKRKNASAGEGVAIVPAAGPEAVGLAITGRF